MIVKLLLICYLVFFVYVDVVTGRYLMLAVDAFIPSVLYTIIILMDKTQKEK